MSLESEKDPQLFALIAQRLLAFDEPVSRIAKVKKNLSRLPLAQPARIDFASMLHLHCDSMQLDESIKQTNFIFSLAFAYSEVMAFKDLAFVQARALINDFALGAQARLEQQTSHLFSEPISASALLWFYFLVGIDFDWGAYLANEGCRPEDQAYRQQWLYVRDNVQRIIQYCDVELANCVTVDFFAEIKSIAQKLKPDTVLLVEGQSEAIVLPHIARIIDRSFADHKIFCLSCGGAKQVVRKYLVFKDTVHLTLFCLLDGDADEVALDLNEVLREGDVLVSLSVSELEDVFSLEQMLKVVESQLSSLGLGEDASLSPEEKQSLAIRPRKEKLEKLFKDRLLGDFDKIQFAHSVCRTLQKPQDLPQELKDIVSLL